MPEFELKEGRGSLFNNRKKVKSTHSDFNGSIKIAGKLYWLNGWWREDKNQNRYMSLSATEQKPYDKSELAKTPVVKQARREIPDEEIPF